MDDTVDTVHLIDDAGRHIAEKAHVMVDEVGRDAVYRSHRPQRADIFVGAAIAHDFVGPQGDTPAPELASALDMVAHFFNAGNMRASVPSLRTNWLNRAAAAWAIAAKNSALASQKCRLPSGAIPFQVSIPVVTIASSRT